MSERPWYRLHGVTWVVLGIAVGSLIWMQKRERETPTHNLLHLTYEQGWPLTFRTENLFGKPDDSRPNGGSTTYVFRNATITWSIWRLLLDVSVSIAFLCSTVIAFERFRRSLARGWRFSLKSLLMAPFWVGLILVMHSVWYAELRRWWKLDPWGFGRTGPWFWAFEAAILFAICCTIHTLGWLVGRLISRLSRPAPCVDLSSSTVD